MIFTLFSIKRSRNVFFKTKSLAKLIALFEKYYEMLRTRHRKLTSGIASDACMRKIL